MIKYLDIKGFLNVHLGVGLSPDDKDKIHEEFYEELYDEILTEFNSKYIDKCYEKLEIFNKKKSWDDI